MVNEPGAGQKPSPGQVRSGAFAPAAGQASSICTLCRDLRAFLLLRFEAPLPELLLDPARNRFNPASVGLPLAGCSRNRSGEGIYVGPSGSRLAVLSACATIFGLYISPPSILPQLARERAPVGRADGVSFRAWQSQVGEPVLDTQSAGLAARGDLWIPGAPGRGSSRVARFVDKGSKHRVPGRNPVCLDGAQQELR